MRRHLVVFVVLLQLAALLPFGLLPGSSRTAAAAPLSTLSFTSTWARTDQPVRDGAAVRTWMWGPEPNTYGITEPYAESDGGRRAVQYYDKSRMEITNINGDANSPWYVTNGLLVVEMMTGQMQLGDAEFEGHNPSTAYVAGDGDADMGVSYAALADLRDAPATPTGLILTAVLTPTSDTSVSVSIDPHHAAQNVTAAHLVDVPGLRHNVASVFWTFMNSSGTVWENGGYVNAKLFENPFYATGFPITEAYWTTAEVGGSMRLVLLQCFERRCLTYTPDNPSEWQVEAGNVGLHYKDWRYGDSIIMQSGPSAEANALADGIVAASNADERFYPMLDLADTLGLAVMHQEDGSLANDGGRIRGDGDLYLYASELQLLAEAYDRGDVIESSQLGIDLGTLLFGNDTGLDLEVIRQQMHAASEHIHLNPDDPEALALLVVRQLGLAAPKPYDLFSPDPLPLEALRFDSVQQWLLLTDVILPLLEPALPLGATFDADPGCGTPWSDGGQMRIGAFGHRLHDAIGDLPDLDLSYALSGYHAFLLGKALQVTTHQSSVSGGPGSLLTFGVKVEVVTHFSPNRFSCGWLRSDELPGPGPLADVSVHWIAVDLIGNRGSVECPHDCNVNPDLPIVLTSTDGSGNSTLPIRLYNGGGSAHGLVLAGVSLGLPIYDVNGHLPGMFPVRGVAIPWHIAS